MHDQRGAGRRGQGECEDEREGGGGKAETFDKRHDEVLPEKHPLLRTAAARTYSIFGDGNAAGTGGTLNTA